MKNSLPLCMIAALAENRVIGRDNQLPWHLPADLKHFKALTLGKPIIMGRKTWDSLPERFRPLPGRRNIVITRQADWSENGAQRASSLAEALQLCEQDAPATVWVMGGGQIYAQALPLADRVEVTEIAQDFAGDTFAPVLGEQWHAAARQDHVGAGGLAFSFVRYQRQPTAVGL